MSVNLFLIEVVEGAPWTHDEPTAWVVAARDETAATALCTAAVDECRVTGLTRTAGVPAGPFNVRRIGTAARGIKPGTVLTQTIDG